MKLSRYFWIVPILLIVGIGTVACSKNDPNILYYTCPMHPQIQKQEPGRCPICGMTLVPVKKGEAPPASSTPGAGHEGHEGHEGHGGQDAHPNQQSAVDAAHPGVYIPPDRVALAGVKTATVVKKDVTIDLRTTGQVANNPDLAIAQKEYLIARKLGGERDLQSSVLSKLHLLGMSDAWVSDVVRRGTPDKELYQPVDGSRVFIEASVYENDLSSVIVGQKAIVTFTHQGNAEYAGTIVGLNPSLSPATRAATAFIEIPQKIQPLRAGMVVSVRFESNLGPQLVVPESAVMDTGKRQMAVVVQDNYYDPREVQVGAHADGMVVVKSGLQEGETVVSAANFLVDSEAQLKERLSTVTGHPH